MNPLIAQPILITEADALNLIESPIGTERQLTDREIEALTLLANGLTRKQAARRMHIRPRTIDRKLSSVRIKLGARTRYHVIALAVTRGFVTITL